MAAFPRKFELNTQFSKAARGSKKIRVKSIKLQFMDVRISMPAQCLLLFVVL